MAKAKLDRTRPFAAVSSMSNDPGRAAYEQDAMWFNLEEEEIGKTDGFHRREEAAAKTERDAAAKQEVDRVTAAAALLGGLGGDPEADAQRENAQAAAAEALSDDAPTT